ncbi:MAG: caspase family protein [Caldilinea sp. CFX5]|nr:caspase family protein [Caldilinea sp. CFX5]
MTTTFDHGYALLIGVGKCKYPKWSLPATVRDMQVLYDLLIDPALCAYPATKEHVRLLHDDGATKQAILDGLAWLRQCAAADPDATVLIFYSGHGKLDLSTLNYFLIPHDYDPAPGGQLLFPADEFHKAIRQIEAKRLLLFLDCCHAEGMATAKEVDDNSAVAALTSVAMPDQLIKSLSEGEGRVVFSSSRGSQKSYIRTDGKMSIYTYHLAEALQGAGNQPGDQQVKVSNLMNYLDNTVPATSLTEQGVKQKPFFDFATEDFPVAVLRGGKGLPGGGWNAVAEKAQEQIQKLVTIHVTGDGNVTAGGNLENNTIITGNNNVVGDNNTVTRIKRLDTGGAAFVGGNVNTGGGDFVGRDKIVSRETISRPQNNLDALFAPLLVMVELVPAPQQPVTRQTLERLKKAIATEAGDEQIAEIVEALQGQMTSVPPAALSALLMPIVTPVAGPITKFVLKKIQ